MSDNLNNFVALNSSYSTPAVLCAYNYHIMLCESLTKCRWWQHCHCACRVNSVGRYSDIREGPTFFSEHGPASTKSGPGHQQTASCQIHRRSYTTSAQFNQVLSDNLKLLQLPSPHSLLTRRALNQSLPRIRWNMEHLCRPHKIHCPLLAWRLLYFYQYTMSDLGRRKTSSLKRFSKWFVLLISH